MRCHIQFGAVFVPSNRTNNAKIFKLQGGRAMVNQHGILHSSAPSHNEVFNRLTTDFQGKASWAETWSNIGVADLA